jgi:hypothetical protein
MDSPDTSNKKQKTTHPYVEFNGVIYIDTSPSQAKPGTTIHNMDEETATLIDAQEELAFDFEDVNEESEEIASISASPLTLPRICNKVRLPEDGLLFPPNWSYDDSTSSMPDLDSEDDEDVSLDDFDFHSCDDQKSSCDLSHSKLVL